MKKSVTDASKLNGAEKAAVVLLSLGEEHHALWPSAKPSRRAWSTSAAV